MLNTQWITYLSVMPLKVTDPNLREFFRIGTSGGSSMYGDITPAMRIEPDSSDPARAILTLIPIDPNARPNMDDSESERFNFATDIPYGEWSTIEIAQLADGDSHTVTIRINGAVISTKENPDAYDFMDLTMSASGSSEYANADVLLKDIQVMTFSENFGICEDNGSQFICTCAEKCLTKTEDYLTTCVSGYVEDIDVTVETTMDSIVDCKGMCTEIGHYNKFFYSY